MTDEQKNAPPAGGDWDGLKLQAGKIEQQFVNYEQHISQRFENLTAQVENMNRLLARIHGNIGCITLILALLALFAAAAAVLACTGWFGLPRLIAAP